MLSVILFMKPHKAFSLFAFESSGGREFFHNFFLSAAQSVFGFVIQVWIYITSKLAFANKISAAISHGFKFSICSHKLEAEGVWRREAGDFRSKKSMIWETFQRDKSLIFEQSRKSHFSKLLLVGHVLISRPTKRFLFIAPMQTKCVNRIGINWLRKFVPHAFLFRVFF